MLSSRHLPPPSCLKNVSHLLWIKVITQNKRTILTRIGVFSAQAAEIFSIARRLGPSLQIMIDNLLCVTFFLEEGGGSDIANRDRQGNISVWNVSWNDNCSKFGFSCTYCSGLVWSCKIRSVSALVWIFNSLKAHRFRNILKLFSNVSSKLSIPEVADPWFSWLKYKIINC